MFCRLIFCLLLLFVAPHLALSAHGLADLEALYAEKNYAEFLAHAKDIAPSLRDQHWRQMVEAMATGSVRELMTTEQFTAVKFDSMEALLGFQNLRTSTLFLKAREEAGVFLLKKCFEGAKTLRCDERLLAFFKAGAQTATLGLKLVHLLKDANISWRSEYLQILSVIAKSADTDVSCDDPVVASALINEMAAWPYSVWDDKVATSKISELMNAKCWIELVPQLKKAAFSRNESLRVPALSSLMVKKAMSQGEQDAALIFNLLENPVQGALFNNSWNLLEAFSRSHRRRQDCLRLLIAFDPLPGKIFSSPNVQKRNTLLDRLSDDFPEYLDHYSKTCLDYMTGKKTFENGNPTPNCRDLFTASKGKTWVETSLQKKFESIP
jgi:hypothetical protein